MNVGVVSGRQPKPLPAPKPNASLALSACGSTAPAPETADATPGADMLDVCALVPKATVDLGSGDGRTVITAAKRGANARGVKPAADSGAPRDR